MSNRNNTDQQSPSRIQLKAQLCELYFEIRSKLDEGSAIYLRRVIPLDDDQSTVFNTDYTVVLQYIKQIITYLTTTKEELEQIIEQKNSNECSDYETCLQKLEAEVRQHIRIEQQLKLYAETTQEKLEQVTKEKEDIEEKLKGVNIDQIKQLEKSHTQIIDQLKRRDDEYQQVQIQYKQKTEQVEQQEETIKQLKSQIQQLQLAQQQQQQQNHLSNSQWLQSQQISSLQFNPHQISGDSSQSSKMVSVNPNQQTSQQNLNELSYMEAKRGKRSVSSMNEDTIKKYTQFSQSSQINPQQILSSNSQITYNTQNKIPNVNINDQITEQQATRMYTDPHVQERSSSRLGNAAEMKENRKSFDKYASSIQEKLMKKDGQNNYYYNENNNNSSINNNNNSYKNIQQQTSNLMNSKLTTTSTLTSAQPNNRQISGQLGIQKQPQQPSSTMPIVGSSNNNNSSLLINSSKQKTTQQQPIHSTQQQSGYLHQSGIQVHSQIPQQASLYPTQMPNTQQIQGQQSSQQGIASGSRIKYTNHQQNTSLTGINQTSVLPSTNSINGGSSIGQYQYDGGYQTLDSQRNKQSLSNKLNEIQNCLSSRQQNTGVTSTQQPVQAPSYQAGTHLRNSSNQSIPNTGDKSNIMNNSYTLQHYQQQQHSQQQVGQSIGPGVSQLNSSSIKYSPATNQISYSHTQQIQQNPDLNKSQRSFMNASGNNNNNNNNLSMNQYNSKEQNSSNININSTSINGANNNSSNHMSGNFKNNSQLNSQVNSNHLTGNTKYGQYIQSQRPNSSFEKSNPYIQNTQQQYKPSAGVVGVSNPQQNSGLSNNGQLQYQQQVGHHNPRSQSMDGFQKQQQHQQQPINKPGNSHQTQNAYLKQKTTSQMQTAEAINNMIKNFKMN